jgi:hypothetical protein
MKPKNRLPVIANFDEIAKAWEAEDAPARAQREHARALVAIQRSRQKLAARQQAELERQRRWLAEKEERETIDRPLMRKPKRDAFVGSSALGGPAPGPHYGNHPGPGIPAYLHDGGRGTGGSSGTYLLSKSDSARK